MKQPSILKQVKSLAETAIRTIRYAKFFATEEERDRRLAICLACEHCTTEMVNRFGKSDGKPRCKLCGCRLEAKTFVYAAKCGADKWISEGAAVSYKDDIHATCERNGCQGKMIWNSKHFVCNTCNATSIWPFRIEK